MTGSPRSIEPPKLNSVAEFFAQALAIEGEATERYNLLADQMEVHNNKEIAAIFREKSELIAKSLKLGLFLRLQQPPPARTVV